MLGFVCCEVTVAGLRRRGTGTDSRGRGCWSQAQRRRCARPRRRQLDPFVRSIRYAAAHGGRFASHAVQHSAHSTQKGRRDGGEKKCGVGTKQTRPLPCAALQLALCPSRCLAYLGRWPRVGECVRIVRCGAFEVCPRGAPRARWVMHAGDRNADGRGRLQL